MNRYGRQTCLPELGERGQQRLLASRVVVAGAGGLGSALLPLLAGAGVGRIALFDPDLVEEHNLHRQTIFRMADIGHSKAGAAAAHLVALNPDCQIEARAERLEPANAADAVARSDLVIDAADSFAVSYTLSDLCRDLGKPLITASVLGRQGYAGGFCGDAPSLRAVFPDPPPASATCTSAGVMGPAVATLGAIQAQMALSVLLGHLPSPLGMMISVDFASWRISQFRFDGAPEPEEVFPVFVSASGLGARDVLIDLRDPDAPDLSDLSPAEGQRPVLACTTGLRAWRAARSLREQGHVSVAVCALGS